MDTQARILLALDRIRPALQLDGGDIAFVEWSEPERRLRVSLGAACSTCHQAATTLHAGVERVLKQLVPEVAVVEAV